MPTPQMPPPPGERSSARGNRGKRRAGARSEAAKPAPAELADLESAEEPPGDDVPPEDALEFLKAVDDYKRLNRRLFPSLTEILRIARSLGYRKR